MLRIGRIELATPVVLAPMAGVTDAPFRVLCAEQGGGMFVSEMLTARGLVEGGQTSWSMARHHADEQIRSIQLYGADPVAMGEAVRRLVATGRIDHVDLNFGCPVPKITRNGGGAALPVRRRLLARIVRAAVDASEGMPITVKMRMGLDDDRLTYLEAGRTAADEGAAAVALHARTAIQGYSGNAAWEAIARLRQALPADVPVLGNGDVWAAADAVAMIEDTGCDGVVIGRGCLGRPWLFADLDRAFAGTPVHGPPTLGGLVPSIERHLELMLDWYGDEAAAVRKLRKHLRWYLQGYPIGQVARRAAGSVTNAEEVRELLATLDPDAEVLPEAIAAPRGRTDAMARLVLPHGWCEAPDAVTPVEDPLLAHSGG
jgi:nifR3 family TIM-barrel protein